MYMSEERQREWVTEKSMSVCVRERKWENERGSVYKGKKVCVREESETKGEYVCVCLCTNSEREREIEKRGRS